MRGLAYALGMALTALGLLALGADAYWSWKAGAWTFEPIGGWLDRLDPAWTEGLRNWAIEHSARTLKTTERVLSWPVWPPAFILGGLLSLVVQRRA